MADETRLNNPLPELLARVFATSVGGITHLGPSDEDDVYVTAAEDIEGLNAREMWHRLAIREAPAYYVIEFPTERVHGTVASPVFRAHQCFVGGGRTPGGAREFIIPNQPIPPDATIREVT